MMQTDGEGLPETDLSNGSRTTQSIGGHPSRTRPQQAFEMAERDFLYQRRLVSLRPFVTDDGVPGLNLRFEGDEMIAIRIERPLLDVVHKAICRLKESPRVNRKFAILL